MNIVPIDYERKNTDGTYRQNYIQDEPPNTEFDWVNLKKDAFALGRGWFVVESFQLSIDQILILTLFHENSYSKDRMNEWIMMSSGYSLLRKISPLKRCFIFFEITLKY